MEIIKLWRKILSGRPRVLGGYIERPVCVPAAQQVLIRRRRPSSSPWTSWAAGTFLKWAERPNMRRPTSPN